MKAINEVKNVITVSKEAATKIKDLAKKQNKISYGMKLQVIPGGCASYQYAMYLEKGPSKDDIVVEDNGVKIFIEKNSLHLLKGTRIHYIDNFYGASFKFENPNVKESCHCGKSFG